MVRSAGTTDVQKGFLILLRGLQLHGLTHVRRIVIVTKKGSLARPFLFELLVRLGSNCWLTSRNEETINKSDIFEWAVHQFNNFLYYA